MLLCSSLWRCRCARCSIFRLVVPISTPGCNAPFFTSTSEPRALRRKRRRSSLCRASRSRATKATSARTRRAAAFSHRGLLFSARRSRANKLLAVLVLRRPARQEPARRATSSARGPCASSPPLPASLAPAHSPSPSRLCSAALAALVLLRTESAQGIYCISSNPCTFSTPLARLAHARPRPSRSSPCARARSTVDAGDWKRRVLVRRVADLER